MLDDDKSSGDTNVRALAVADADADADADCSFGDVELAAFPPPPPAAAGLAELACERISAIEKILTRSILLLSTSILSMLLPIFLPHK